VSGLLRRRRKRRSRRREVRRRVVRRIGVDPIDADQVRRYQSRLRGGLIVIRVRGDSPAAQISIVEGDVIVGIENWETVSIDNVEWILDHAQQIKNGEPIRLLILRDGRLLESSVRLGEQ
jgi:S1-C subfamily serine protease